MEFSGFFLYLFHRDWRIAGEMVFQYGRKGMLEKICHRSMLRPWT
jgi:hypothetical protein